METKQFTPKQWVLVRDSSLDRWKLDIYSHCEEGKEFSHVCLSSLYKYCIQYEGNEHLLNTNAEPEKPYNPHDGDFLMSKNGDYMFIYNENGECLTSLYVGFSIKQNSLTRSGETIFAAHGNHIEDYRPATEEEKQKFIERLHSEKIDWDSENKKVVDWEWEPTKGEEYHFPSFNSISCCFMPAKSFWHSDDTDSRRKKSNIVCRTNVECLTLCEKLNKAIQNVK